MTSSGFSLDFTREEPPKTLYKCFNRLSLYFKTEAGELSPPSFQSSTVAVQYIHWTDVIRVCGYDLSPHSRDCHIKAALLTFLTDKREGILTKCAEPFPISPHASTVVTGIRRRVPVTVFGQFVTHGSFSHWPQPGRWSALCQTDPDLCCHATSCCLVHQPLHVTMAADGSEVSVVTTAIIPGLKPALSLVYQVILMMNVWAQSDVTCKTPIKNNKVGIVIMCLLITYISLFYVNALTWSEQQNHQIQHILSKM